MMNEENKYKHIAPEKFKLVQQDAKISDVKFDTKPVSYMKDAFTRFKKNKSSVVAAIIIIFLLIFAIFGPIFSKYDSDQIDGYYKQSLPKASAFEWAGWDGTKVEKNVNQMSYDKFKGIGLEKNSSASNEDYAAIKEFIDVKKVSQTVNGKDIEVNQYKLDVDSYNKVGYIFQNLDPHDYFKLQAYQKQAGVQVFFPLTNYYQFDVADANVWYEITDKELTAILKQANVNQPFREEFGTAKVTDEYVPAYMAVTFKNVANYYGSTIDGDDGTYTYKRYSLSGSKVNVKETKNCYYRYAEKNQTGYKVRLLYKEFYKFNKTEFNYKNGLDKAAVDAAIAAAQSEADYQAIIDMFEFDLDTGFYAEYWFGSNENGKDLFTLLGIGARLSFILAITISAINLTIGAIYGAIEGYYGGTADLIMERIAEILSGVPFIVVATLFKLHLADKVGMLGSLLFAFVLTGWIGMAGRVRMQFYRFKGQEYILSSRTLGAKDFRIMFKHIFPNAIGTIITGSILSIPGVVFTESMLSYLGIIDLETSGLTSIGTLLSAGSKFVDKYEHILLFPTAFIALLMISFNLFGNGLRDAFNPSLRGSED